MTDKIRWKIEEHLPENQTRCSLRTLLHDQWLLPNRYVHFLRRRHHVPAKWSLCLYEHGGRSGGPGDAGL